VVRPRRKRDVPVAVYARRLALVAATALVVGTGFAAQQAPDSAPSRSSATVSAPALFATVEPLTTDRADGDRASRSARREALTSQRRDADTRSRPEPRKRPDLDLAWRWLTADLNVWSGPGESNRLLTVLPEGSRVQQTGSRTGAWAQVVRGDRLAWVRAAYLVAQKPAPEPEVRTESADGGTDGSGGSDGTGGSGGGTETGSPSGSVSGAPCPDGSSVESGLTSAAVGVYRAVCAEFPAVSSWGGLRPGDDGDHGTGQALDIMVGSDSALGQAIADYVQSNAGALGVSEILWSQQIWSVERSSEGWRAMEDRGSTTANHYDHVHVSVY
jgi:hypothetical protein